MQGFSRFSRVFVVVILLFLALGTADATEVPRQFNYQGYLRDSSANPMNGLVNFQFYIYPDSTGGTPCWGPETFLEVEVVGGFFELVLGSKAPIDAACFDGTPKWLEIWIGGAPLTPRKPINSVPYAFAAIGAGAGIDSVVAGAGLTAQNGGGPIVTLEVGAGTGITVDADAVSLDTSYTDSRYVNEGEETGIGGSGTQGFLPKFTDSTTVVNSKIFDDGTAVGIGTTTPTALLEVVSTILAHNFVDRDNPEYGVDASAPLSATLAGKVGIGTTSPQGMLDITGGALALDGDPGTSGQVLTSQGTGVSPVWAAASGPRIKIGSYAGDSQTTHSITGVGFQPDLVIVMVVGNVNIEAHQVMRHRDHDSGISQNFGSGRMTNGILDFHADGFSVGNHNYVNGSPYFYGYIAIRE